MKKSKEKSFSELIEEYSELAKALAHPGRIEIIKMLMIKNNQTCQELVDQLPYSQSTVSQHLARLKQAGFIEATGYKTATIFTLNYEFLQHFNQLFSEVFGMKPKPVQFSLF